MQNLNNIQWGEFYLKDVFNEIQRGKRLKKEHHKRGEVPYISSTSMNNGVDGFVGNKENVRLFSSCLTIANSGSVGSTFFQPFTFVASDHVTKLSNSKFNRYVYLFISTTVKKLGEKYSFNREINDNRIKKEKILLPINEQGEPDYAFMEQYMREKERQLVDKYKEYLSFEINGLGLSGGGVNLLANKAWGEFFMEDIFHINAGKRLTKLEMKCGKTPFIGASDSNNGITAYVSNTNSSLSSNVLGVNYNGSVVENFYHPYKALFSDDVKKLSFKHINGNEFLYLFAKSVILQQKSKYQYAYKFNEGRMLRQKILLPVNKQGAPDYVYMENYMKHLGYQKLNAYLQGKASVQ